MLLHAWVCFCTLLSSCYHHVPPPPPKLKILYETLIGIQVQSAWEWDWNVPSTVKVLATKGPKVCSYNEQTVCDSLQKWWPNRANCRTTDLSPTSWILSDPWHSHTFLMYNLWVLEWALQLIMHFTLLCIPMIEDGYVGELRTVQIQQTITVASLRH